MRRKCQLCDKLLQPNEIAIKTEFYGAVVYAHKECFRELKRNSEKKHKEVISNETL